MLFLSKKLNGVAKNEFGDAGRIEQTRNCFPRAVFYCCDTPEVLEKSADRHGTGRQHSVVRRHTTYSSIAVSI